MSEDEAFRPDRKWLADRLRDLKSRNSIDYLWAQDQNATLTNFQAEMTLLNLETQKLLQETIERSIKSQDRLANTQNLLVVIGLAIALLQLIGMFIIPNL